MTEPLLLAVDLGTSGMKVALITVSGKVLGWESEPVRLLVTPGGGAQSDVWCQIFTDVLDVEIQQVADPICANARGAAWIAAVGLGEIRFGDVPGLVKIKRSYDPRGENRKLYDERFHLFTQIYKHMKPIYGKMNG